MPSTIVPKHACWNSGTAKWKCLNVIYLLSTYLTLKMLTSKPFSSRTRRGDRQRMHKSCNFLPTAAMS